MLSIFASFKFVMVIIITGISSCHGHTTRSNFETSRALHLTVAHKPHTVFLSSALHIPGFLYSLYIYTIMSNPRSFSIHGQGLKLNSRADIEPHLQVLRAMEDVEEVHFGGNTLGVEASEAIAEVLTDLKSLKVRKLFYRHLHQL